MSSLPRSQPLPSSSGCNPSPIAQTSQFPEMQDHPPFSPAPENALNGPKIGSATREGGSRFSADVGMQSPLPPGDRSEDRRDDEAGPAEAYRRFLEIQEQRRADEAAAQAARSERRSFPFQRIIIPSADEIQDRRGRGRPRVIDEELRHKIVALLGAGASLTQTAAHVGVARNTITRALEADEEFADEVHEARQRASLFPLNCLLREASKNWRAAAWLLTYLERKTEEERTRRERVFEAADQEIERDLVQELREEARRERRAATDDAPANSAAPRQGTPEFRPARRRRASESSRSTKSGGCCGATDDSSMTCGADSGHSSRR